MKRTYWAIKRRNKKYEFVGLMRGSVMWNWAVSKTAKRAGAKLVRVRIVEVRKSSAVR